MNQTGWVEGIWGEANSTYLPGGELISMTFDHHASLLIINQNPSRNLNNRRPEIVKFNEVILFIHHLFCVDSCFIEWKVCRSSYSMEWIDGISSWSCSGLGWKSLGCVD